MKTKVENLQKLWTIQLEMISTEDPSIDTLENTLTKLGYIQITVGKTPVNIKSE